LEKKTFWHLKRGVTCVGIKPSVVHKTRKALNGYPSIQMKLGGGNVQLP